MADVTVETRADRVARACWVAEVALTDLQELVAGAESTQEALALYDQAKAIETLSTRVVFTALDRADKGDL